MTDTYHTERLKKLENHKYDVEGAYFGDKIGNKTCTRTVDGGEVRSDANWKATYPQMREFMQKCDILGD